MLTTLLYSIFGFILAIAILVTVHEFGHFQVARKFGVIVLRFSIGFGRTLFKWERKDDYTKYCIGAIPLGGYVQMLEVQETDKGFENLKRYAFNHKPLAVRAAIVAAGPAYNFIFAAVAIWLMLVVGNSDTEPVVGRVDENSIAAAAGFQVGDRLVAIDGREVRAWRQHQLYLVHQAMKQNIGAFTVRGDDGRTRNLQVDFAALNQYDIVRDTVTNQIGLAPPSPPATVFRVAAASPAAAAGLQQGDRILSVDGETVGDWNDLVAAVQPRANQSVALLIRRDGAEIYTPITIAAVMIDGQEYGQLGLYRPPPANLQLRYGVLEAVPAALDYGWRITAVTMRAIARMLTARMSAENLSGPITIARVAGHTVQAGFTDFLKFLAIISISIGLLNLMPIPLLDGGHLLFFAVEAVKGSPPSTRAVVWGRVAGIVMLAAVMSIALYNDIMLWF